MSSWLPLAQLSCHLLLVVILEDDVILQMIPGHLRLFRQLSLNFTSNWPVIWCLDLTSPISSLFLLKYPFVILASLCILLEMSTISCSTSWPCRHPPHFPRALRSELRGKRLPIRWLPHPIASLRLFSVIVTLSSYRMWHVSRSCFLPGSENESSADGFVCGKGLSRGFHKASQVVIKANHKTMGARSRSPKTTVRKDGCAAAEANYIPSSRSAL